MRRIASQSGFCYAGLSFGNPRAASRMPARAQNAVTAIESMATGADIRIKLSEY